MTHDIRISGIDTFRRLLTHCEESKYFSTWLKIALDWADRNAIEIHPVEDPWGVKIVFYDSVGRFFDYAYPKKRKAGETDDDYRDRVWKELDKECVTIRRLRNENITGRKMAARAA